jgi:hypothetical protein
MNDKLDFILKFPDKCCAEVSRKGESQPCDKMAVAVTIDVEDGHWWPVCPHHSRGRPMMSLAELIEVLEQ